MLNKSQILISLSITHTILGMIVLSSIYFYSIDYDVQWVDIVACLVPISFIIFRRCIHLDLHEWIRDNDDLPEYTEDGYYFNQLQKLIFKKEIISKSHLKEYKGGYVDDVEHFCELEDEDIIKDIFNEKLHYVVINCILVVTLLSKYNMKRLIPLYLGWFMYNFS